MQDCGSPRNRQEAFKGYTLEGYGGFIIAQIQGSRNESKPPNRSLRLPARSLHLRRLGRVEPPPCGGAARALLAAVVAAPVPTAAAAAADAAPSNVFIEIVPTGGRVMVNGFSMSRIKERQLPLMRRTIGVIFQDFRLIAGRCPDRSRAY